MMVMKRRLTGRGDRGRRGRRVERTQALREREELLRERYGHRHTITRSPGLQHATTTTTATTEVEGGMQAGAGAVGVGRKGGMGDLWGL